MTKPDSVFFTTLCFSMQHVWTDRIATAACDGKKIYWNPDFFMSLANKEEQVFLMLHETMHAAYMHMDPVRSNGKCPNKWNIAADHVINLQLIERGFTMPTGKNKGVADSKYAGMSAEEVYALLPKDSPQSTMPDLEAPSEGEMDQIRSDMQDNLIRASIQSKMANDAVGTIPGEIEIFLNKLLNPKLPWFRILQNYLQTFAKSDYSFKKPNKRFFPKHHLPSLHSNNLIDLAIAVDTSGSVTDSDFLRFVTETNSILKMMKPSNITVIQFDSTIKSIDKVSCVKELMNIKFKGRGGTQINPVVNWANENKPQLLLVFSDGDFYCNHIESKVNTLWIIHENLKFKAPYGKVIHYSM